MVVKNGIGAKLAILASKNYLGCPSEPPMMGRAARRRRTHSFFAGTPRYQRIVDCVGGTHTHYHTYTRGRHGGAGRGAQKRATGAPCFGALRSWGSAVRLRAPLFRGSASRGSAVRRRGTFVVRLSEPVEPIVQNHAHNCSTASGLANIGVIGSCGLYQQRSNDGSHARPRPPPPGPPPPTRP